MKVTYTGRHIDLLPSQIEELQAEFTRVGRLLDQDGGDAGARVVLAHEHNTNSVEVTVAWHGHELVSTAEGADLFTAIHAAAGKIEKQAHKVREKWRDSRRAPAQ